MQLPRRLLLAAAMPAAAMAQAPRMLRVAVEAEITSTDPHFHNLAPNKAISAHVFEALVLQDARQRLLPGLATSWRAVDDTTWEFSLRPGVTWHDGTAFTAEDVAFPPCSGIGR